MSYIPGFGHDLFVSYAHADNAPFGPKQSGWVSDFHRNLEIRLSQLLTQSATIWRDPRLGGAEILWDTLQAHLSEAAVLIAVLSPRYLESSYCRDELDFFVQRCQSSGGLTAGTRKRILKVLKTSVPLEQHPEIMRDMVGYEFYRVEQSSGKVRELHLDPSPEAQLEYWARLDDLAYEIRTLLMSMRDARGGQLAGAAPGTGSSGAMTGAGAPSVYIASTTQDLRQERDQLLRELRSRGCRVLPERPLPLVGEELRTAVQEDLTQAQLSVHLIGGYYGAIPEGETRSVIHLQNEMARERATRGSFSRILWMSRTLEPQEERQRQWISELEGYSSSRNGFEILKTSIEDLKDFVRDKLQPKRAVPMKTSPAATVARQVYLICDGSDFDAGGNPEASLQAVRDYLFDAGCEVCLPLLTGDPQDLRTDHEDSLRVCDVALVYWGRASELWVRAKLRDFVKIPALGREGLPHMAIYIGAPESASKRVFRSQLPVVNATTGFDPSAARELLS
jgi:hypothetical protein